MFSKGSAEYHMYKKAPYNSVWILAKLSVYLTIQGYKALNSKHRDYNIGAQNFNTVIKSSFFSHFFLRSRSGPMSSIIMNKLTHNVIKINSVGHLQHVL